MDYIMGMEELKKKMKFLKVNSNSMRSMEKVNLLTNLLESISKDNTSLAKEVDREFIYHHQMKSMRENF